MLNGTGVVRAHADLRGMEHFFREAIMEKLADDKDALKAFEVEWHHPTSIEEAKEIDRLGIRLMDVKGAIGLNDSGQGWKIFQITIEEGHDDDIDKEIAEQLAFQCMKCVAELRRAEGLSVANIRDRQLKKYRK